MKLSVSGYLVFNVGCIECGVSSDVVGVYDSRAEADHVAERLGDCLHWREGGQNSFEVFSLSAPMHEDYESALKEGEL